MADWGLTVHDAKTGLQRAVVQSSDSSWSASLGSGGTADETFLLRDAENPWPAGRVAELFEPNDRLLARWWGDYPLTAQKVEDYAYEADTGKLTVHCVDLATETAWRMLGGVDGLEPGNVIPPLELVSMSPRTAIGAAYARMMQWDFQWVYPIDIPAAAPGPISGTWEFWKKYRISEIIEEIAQRAGAEVYLRPYNAGGRNIRFTIDAAPAITAGVSRINLSASDCPISAITYRVSGASQVTGVMGVGNGTGEDQETKWAGTPPYLIPIRDTKQSFPDLAGNDLQQATDAFYAANRGPVGQWSVGTFTISDDWSPLHAIPGRVWEVESYGDPVLPSGISTLRVIKVSGGNGRQLAVEVSNG